MVSHVRPGRRASTRSDARAMGRDTGGVTRHERLAARTTDGPRDGRRARRPRSCSSSPRTATASARRSPSTRSRAAAPRACKTIKLTEKKGGLAGALIVREHQELVFISQNGMVQRTAVQGISQQGRAAQGVRVMNLREDDRVSAVALVVESAADQRCRRLPRNCRRRARTDARSWRAGRGRRGPTERRRDRRVAVRRPGSRVRARAAITVHGSQLD